MCLEALTVPVGEQLKVPEGAALGVSMILNRSSAYRVIG